MTSITEHNSLHAIVDFIISGADPAALGGAPGEYENQINQIVKFILEKRMPINTEVLRQIFVQGFPDCNLSASEEFSRMAEEINAKVL